MEEAASPRFPRKIDEKIAKGRATFRKRDQDSVFFSCFLNGHRLEERRGGEVKDGT